MKTLPQTEEKSTIWLKMDFNASLTNVLISFPIVLVAVVVAWDVARVQFVTGLMSGVWLASLHNIVWGWLTRRIAEKKE